MSTPTDIDPSLFDETPAPALPTEIEPEDDIDFALATAEALPHSQTTTASPVPTMALVEILPPEFDLPRLTMFVPRRELKAHLDEAVTFALTVDVATPDGLSLADSSTAAIRACLKDIETHFAEPTEIAHKLHKRLTGLRGEWMQPGEEAVRTVGRRIAAEKSRLDAIAADARRKAQAEADRIAREQRQREAELAKAQGAPAAVVEQMAAQAKVATAPPVPVIPTAAPLAHTTVTKTWKARVKGTPADAEPIPDTAALTPAQHLQVVELLKAIVAGDVPIVAVKLNDSYLNSRAKAEKQTLAIPGFEAYEEQGTRARPGRRV
jgi:hypothetical protein